MRRIFLFPLLVLFAVLIKSEAEENQEPKALNDAEALSYALRQIFPANTIKQLSNEPSENFDNGTKCTEQLTLLREGLIKGSIWALKMVDASSKIPSGILKGNQVDLGMFDECVEISVNEDGHEIRGRHCMYSLIMELVGMPISQALSVCLPASCEAKDVEKLMKSIIEPVDKPDVLPTHLDITIKVGDTMCTAVDSPEWTVGGILTLTAFSLLLLFLVVCTVFDVYTILSNDRPTKNGRIEKLRKFSIYSNALRTLSTKSAPDTLPAIQGLRVYSMCWIVMGHAFIVPVILRRNSNPLDIGQWLTTWNFLYMVTVPFAVDTFFAISGFLMSHVFFKDISNGESFNILRYYLHRYIRLTPAFLAVLLSAIYITPRLGSGALWESSTAPEAKACEHNLWAMLLYIQNYIGISSSGCLGHTWYLAAEMQLFWISPLILYPLAKKPKLGLGILAAFFVASVVTTVKIGYDNEFSSVILKFGQFGAGYMDKFYYGAHVRAGPWLVGIFFGYLYFTQKGSPTSKATKWIGWLLAIGAFSFCILTVRISEAEDYEYNIVWESIYTAISKPAWGFGVSWIIYSSVCGFGGPVSKFLSFSIYSPLSRLSYCIYLVHFEIQFMKSRSARVNDFFSFFNGFDHFSSDILLSLMVGFLFSLVFETPFSILDKMIKKRSKPTKDDTRRAMKLENIENGTDK